ncbi:hypothetical protein BB021_15770 [Elizabethkingia ursingii]|uniref:Uncharacterized protein n=1 Tax=Elizabethkingia ursingii TaxID=1756150 RepID=A0ABX3N3J3_9FLAO|nr:hypothetical protein BB021_15770 [Elizabethkingia ursingii]
MVSHKSGCDFLKFTQIITREEKIAQEYGMIYLIISFICFTKSVKVKLGIFMLYSRCKQFLDYNFIKEELRCG